MTNKEAIKYLQQLYPNGGHCWLDEQRIKALGMAIDALQEEPVNEGLKEAAGNALESISDQYDIISVGSCLEMFRLGSEWSKKHLWKDAQGDDLPEIDREVIALLNNGKVVFAHRPYKGKYIGKSLTTGNIETLENQTFDEGGWNFPDVKYWLDVELPKEIEL